MRPGAGWAGLSWLGWAEPVRSPDPGKLVLSGFFKGVVGFLLGFICILGTVTAFHNFLIVPIVFFSKENQYFKAKCKDIHWQTKENVENISK